MVKKKQTHEIELLQEGKVHLRLSEEGILLSLKWHPKGSYGQIGDKQKSSDEFQEKLDTSTNSQKDSKRMRNLKKLYKSSSSFMSLQDSSNTKGEKKRLKQALIHVLKEFDESLISTIRDSVIDKPSESRGFSKEQPQMSTDLVRYLHNLDRLKELTNYLEKFHPDIMEQVKLNLA